MKSSISLNVFVLLCLGVSAEPLDWKNGPNACYCEPISIVSDCDTLSCNIYLITMVILFTLFTILCSIALYMLDWKKCTDIFRKPNRVLVLFLFTEGITRVLRYSLLLGKVGENNMGTMLFLNILMIIGGVNLLSALTLIVYMWLKVHKHAVSKVSRKHRIQAAKIVLWIVNILTYTLLILFSVFEKLYENEVFSILFDAVVGSMVLLIGIGFLTLGLRLYFTAKKNPLVSSSDMRALQKLTRLIAIICLMAISYVITQIVYGRSDQRTTTSSVLERNSVQRVIEFLLLTFNRMRKTENKEEDNTTPPSPTHTAFSTELIARGAPTNQTRV